MDLFGLKAHEEQHEQAERVIRHLVEGVSQLSISLAQTRLELRKLSLKVDGKVDESDVDPAIVGINRALGAARVKLAEAAESAEENWNALSAELEKAVEDVNDRSESLSPEDQG